MAEIKPTPETAPLAAPKARLAAELRDLAELTTQLARQQNGIDTLFAEQISDLHHQVDYQTELAIQLDHESVARLRSLAELSMQVVQMHRTLHQLAQRVSSLEQALQSNTNDE